MVNGAVTATDVDAGSTLSFALNGAAPAGLTFNADGSYSFNPGNAAYQSLGVGQSTVITVPYTVTDNAGATSTANLVITVTGTNDAPVAQAASFTVAEDAAVVNGSVIATDVDAGATLSYVLNGAAPAGLTFNSNGSYSFNPPTRLTSRSVSASRRSSPCPTVTDNAGATSTANLVITVTGTNDAPVANANTVAATEDNALTIAPATLLGNDTDIDNGTTLTITSVQGAVNGSGRARGRQRGVHAGGELQRPGVLHLHRRRRQRWYVHRDRHGQRGGGQRCAGRAGGQLHRRRGCSGGQRCRHGHRCGRGSTLSFALNGAAPAGLTFNSNGSWQLQPPGTLRTSRLGVGQSTVITVPYTVTDNAGATSTANLVITVTGTNDAPVAQAASFTVAEDAAVVNGSVIATDVDAGATLSYALNGAAPAGLTFNSNGTYSFNPANAAHQSLGVGQQTIITVPYTVTDNAGATSTANPVITVTGTNDAPVANANTVAATEDSALTIAPATPLGNDTDIDNGTTLTITSVQGAVNGTVALVGSNVVFTPAANYNGPASFTYTVSDGNGGTSTATVTVNVAAVNDAPVAQAASFTVAEDAAVVNGAVTATDADAGATLTFALNGAAPAGLTFNSNGTYSFNPANAAYQSLGVGQSTVITVPYTVTDNAGATSTANLVITVTGTNDAPSHRRASFTVAEDAAVVNGTVTATDVDTGTTLSYALNGAAPAGLTFNSNGTYSFNPGNAAYQSLAAGQSTVITVPYTVTDNAGATSTANLVITVTGTNDAPVAQGGCSFTVAEDAATWSIGSVIGRDADAGATLELRAQRRGPGRPHVQQQRQLQLQPRPTPPTSRSAWASNRSSPCLYTVTDNTGATSTANLGHHGHRYQRCACRQRQHGRCDGRQRADHHPGHAAGQ